MGQELVRHPRFLTQVTQPGREQLNRGAGIGEYEVVVSAKDLVKVCRDLLQVGSLTVVLSCRGRGFQVAADLYRQLLPALSRLDAANLAGLTGAQRVSGEAHVAQGGRQPDPKNPAPQ